MPVHDWTRVDAGIFHAFHHWWIGEISKVLNAGVLPSEYYALPEQDVGPAGPDVLTLQTATGQTQGGASGPSGATALTASPPRVRFTRTLGSVRPRRRLRRAAIHHTSDHRIVAVIEVVSPGNKSSRNSLRAFIDKATTLIGRGIHLLVIDLFPAGPRDPHGMPSAIGAEFGNPPFEAPEGQPLTLASYAAGSSTTAFVEAVGVGGVLPDMPLFLLPDWYIYVPLERSYMQAWEPVPEYWRNVLEAPALPSSPNASP